jgi:hypothetical protein
MRVAVQRCPIEFSEIELDSMRLTRSIRRPVPLLTVAVSSVVKEVFPISCLLRSSSIRTNHGATYDYRRGAACGARAGGGLAGARRHRVGRVRGAQRHRGNTVFSGFSARGNRPIVASV